MAWRWTGDKPLPEPMLTLFTNAYAAQGGDELNERTRDDNGVHWTINFFFAGMTIMTGVVIIFFS